jgi:hypothetical protein
VGAGKLQKTGRIFKKMWPNFFEIGRILSQVWPEGLAVIWQQ